MSKYVTVVEFLESVYGTDFDPVSGSIFSSTGQVDSYLTFISSLIDAYCGRRFDATDYYQEFEGVGQKSLVVENFPLNNVISVVYESFGGTSGLVDPATYKSNSSGIIKFSFPLQSELTYIVNYNSGYSVVPDAIKQATLMLAHSYAQSIDSGAVGIADGGAITSFKFGKFEEHYSDPRQKNVQYAGGIPITVQAILNKFKGMRG